MKKLFAFLAAGLFSVASFAAGESTTGLDTTALDTLLTGLKTDLGTWVTAAVPVLGGIAAIFMVFWLGKVIFRVVKGWSNKAG